MNNNPLPIILSRPHGGLGVPPEVMDLLAIDDISLYNECDLWVDDTFDFSHESLAPLVPDGHSLGVLDAITMPIARGLIDVNRPLRSLGMPDGPVKTTTSYGEQIYHEPLSESLQDQLVQRYWQAYHNQVTEAIERHKGTCKLFLDCHNMAQLGPTKYRDAGKPRPLVCITNLGDAAGEPRPEYGWTFVDKSFAQKAVAIAEELFSDMKLLEPIDDEPPPVALLNQPFWGSYVVVHHFNPDRVAQEYTQQSITPPTCLMIEVNRGLYVGNQTKATSIAPPNQERIGEIRSRLYQWATRLLELL